MKALLILTVFSLIIGYAYHLDYETKQREILEAKMACFKYQDEKQTNLCLKIFDASNAGE